MRKKMMILVACCSVLLVPVRADEIGQFALFEKSGLGRVFMSPAERLQLDQMRLMNPVATNAASVAGEESSPETPPLKRHAAGYIIPHSGRPSAWKDGAFRKIDVGRDLTSLHFGGDIQITRHVGRPDDSDAPEGEGDTAADVALTAVKSTEPVNVQED